MGNRATVIFTDGRDSFSPAVYLHWNGGPESIYAFLEELDARKVRADQDYECARFIHVVGDGLGQGDGHSLGVSNGPESAELSDLEQVQTDLGDNGIYLVNRTTTPLTMRRFLSRGEHLREMSAQDVAREHLEAEQHAYRDSFREDFEAQRKAAAKAAK